jgi:hypothetical protein
MSTKTTPKTEATPITATSALPAAARKPYSIDVCENSFKAFQLASALIRQGYTILKDRPVEIYTNGVAVFTCVLGEPTETGYADAEEAMRKGLEKEQAEFEERVAREVQARVEQIARDAHAAKVAQAVAEHQRAIKALEKAGAADIAALTK